MKYVLLERIMAEGGSRLATCLQCGSCTSVCHAADDGSGMGPEKVLRMILFGFDEDALNTPWVWRCSLCARCRLHCPMDIDVPGIIFIIRCLQKGLHAPEELKGHLHLALTSGNILSIPPFEVVKTLQWIERDLRRTSGNNHYSIPIDSRGADLVVFVNSRDLKFNPEAILFLAYLLNLSRISWTIPSYGFEEANPGAIIGDFKGRDHIALQKIQTMKNLGARGMLLDSCEHAFCRPHMGPRPLRQMESDFVLTTTPQLIYSKIKSGDILPEANPKGSLDKKVIISDPCGVHEDSESFRAVRKILAALGIEARSLEPAPPHTICCGGGGGAGFLSLEERKGLFAQKAQQLMALEPGSLVTTYCRRCAVQISDIIKTYNVDVSFMGIHELLYKALKP